MLREGEPTNPKPGLKPSIFFFLFAYLLEAILLIEDPKLHYEGSGPCPLPPFIGLMVLWDLAPFARLFNLIPTEWDRFDTEVIVLAENGGGKRGYVITKQDDTFK